jgi:hypothetical protein
MRCNKEQQHRDYLLGYLVWATARRFMSLGQARLAQPLGVEGNVLRTPQGH